jgi:hypothetical protein
MKSKLLFFTFAVCMSDRHFLCGSSCFAESSQITKIKKRLESAKLSKPEYAPGGLLYVSIGRIIYLGSG